MRLDVVRTHTPWPGVILRAGQYFGEVPDELAGALIARGLMRESATAPPTAIEKAGKPPDDQQKKRGK